MRTNCNWNVWGITMYSLIEFQLLHSNITWFVDIMPWQISHLNWNLYNARWIESLVKHHLYLFFQVLVSFFLCSFNCFCSCSNFKDSNNSAAFLPSVSSLRPCFFLLWLSKFLNNCLSLHSAKASRALKWSFSVISLSTCILSLFPVSLSEARDVFNTSFSVSFIFGVPP